MYREPKLPHVLCGLSFCEACHFVRPIPVGKMTIYYIKSYRCDIIIVCSASKDHVEQTARIGSYCYQ